MPRRPPFPSRLFPCLLLLLAGCSGGFEARWPTGIVRMRGEGTPRAQSGEWSFYYRSGQLRERGRYESGRRVGRWTQWFPGGQRASDGERVPLNDASGSPREGEWRFWHENGALRAEGRYERGLREGEWHFFDNLGRPDERKSGRYRAGIRQ